jgi:peptidoglycan hydrolase-like protein with peptidoglycan-binding domain
MTLTSLSNLSSATPLETLSLAELSELQTALSMLGYPVGDIDGMVGPRTRTAWAEFKTDLFRGNPDMVGPQSIVALQTKLSVFDTSTYDFSTTNGCYVPLYSDFRGAVCLSIK